MAAALGAADEAVAFLLSKGASPDFIDKDGKTALLGAIQASCSSTIDLLAPVTQKRLGSALMFLATWTPELTRAKKELLIRASSHEVSLSLGVKHAAQMGARV